MTEKTQTLTFQHEEKVISAAWSDLKKLYEHESTFLVKLSALTKSAVQPNNIEKQKVSLALQVFSEKTSAALKTSTLSCESFLQTATFLDEVIHLWKVFNCKTPLQSIYQRDPDRAAIDSSAQGDRQIKTLLAWAERAKAMEPNSHPRQQKLTRDTAKAVHWTCRCLVALSAHLLNTDAAYSHQFVTLGFFQQDDIEQHFGHFRMSAGNNFYISAQDIYNTHAIDKTKLMLQVENESIDHRNASHICGFCTKDLTDSEILCLDDLPEKLATISNDEKMSLIYIGGYICQKHPEHPGFEGDSSLFNENISAFTDNLNRRGLRFPGQELFQTLCYIYLFFCNSSSSLEHSCRKRLIIIFTDFPAIFHINLTLPPAVLSRIVNIMLKRFCLQHTKEDNEHNKKRKLAKLSSSTIAGPS
ncbi:group XV phospholipase a2 [Plakobranchus ocellatus]|uniref:Group XV phospholipase a2 n=1 Tax=Plakobranchus ocellatus TaxID=259542 RepID=A0AAV4BHT0_9GAST|nr:group XV phospholipase a2 [Plakobranchus ocellatus]